MKKLLYLILFIFHFQETCYSNIIDSLLLSCNYDIDELIFNDSMFEFKIQSHAILHKCKNGDKTLDEILSTCDFEKIVLDKLPNKFSSFKYDLWIILKVKNPYYEDKKILLSGNIHKDSYYIFTNNHFQYFEINKYKIKSPVHGNFINGHNRSILNLKANESVYVIYKKSNVLYDKGNGLPLISYANNYESKYENKYHSLNYFYLFSSTFFFAMLFITLLYYYLFKRIEIFIYAIYLFSVLFVNFRNFEWYGLYTNYSVGYLQWFYTKIFHTSAIFLSYAIFVKMFLSLEKTIAKRLLIVIYYLVIGSCIIELILLAFAPQYSYLLYYIFRNSISVIGIIFIFLIWKSINPFSRYILLGTLILLVCDISSNFLTGIHSSMLSTMGTIVEVIIFTTALALWTLNIYKNQLKEVNDSKLAILKKNETIASLRKEFAQDLHDELGSTITKLNLEVYYEQQKNNNKSTFLENIKNKLDILSHQIREMIWLFDQDKSSINELQANMRQVSNEMLDNTPISIEYHFVTVENKFELTPDIYRNLLSIVKEAMANILKHSKATQVQIKSEYDKNIFTIYIIDNGIGIDKSIPNVAGRGRINMQQRVIKINGTIEFLSSDIGTTIKIQIPIVNN